ncbi:MAG: SCP2 sterol-binding domain-containing protein [Parvularcula sp.]|nr:SCP2 sterol-binding domain-containing protein [Parvularcula sp.]
MSSQPHPLQRLAEDSFTKGFGGVLRIENSDDGTSLWVDGREDKPVIGQSAPKNLTGRFCLWRAEAEVLRGVLSGERRLGMLYNAGRLKISGDMAVMARLTMRGGE